MRNFLAYSILGLFISSCTPLTSQNQKHSNSLDPIWYQGKAEISTYVLEQNRYNNTHPGEAVLIFVTEDFLTDKKVKNDTYTRENSIKILKNKKISRFTTGIYDYSIFTSVFNALDGDLEKITFSSQDWCGQSFMQVTSKEQKLMVSNRSYFEKEGDYETQVKRSMTEDELFNQIRIDPKGLILGNGEMIISTQMARLMHKPYYAYPVECTLILEQTSEGSPVGIYSVYFPTLSRTLTITYKDDNTRQILSWKDTYPSSFDQKERTTKAILKSSIWTAYWNENNKSDRKNRSQLQLKNFELTK